MPCRSDHMEPYGREVESKRVAGHLVFLMSGLGIDVPEEIVKASKATYGDADHCDVLTALLCETIQTNSVHDVHAIMYNGRVKKARDLADWWEMHQEHDIKREAEDAMKAERQAVLDSLTPYQRATLFPGE